MFTIPTDKIREVIGTGGKVIREIVEKTGAKIDIEDDGTVKVASANGEAIKAAINWIKSIAAEPEVGQIYEGTVVKVMDFGAFVNFFGAKDGLVHISQLAQRRVQKVKDVVKEGDKVKVKLLGFDERGKVRLSMKVVDQATGEDLEAKQKAEGEQQPRRRPPAASDCCHRRRFISERQSQYRKGRPWAVLFPPAQAVWIRGGPVCAYSAHVLGRGRLVRNTTKCDSEKLTAKLTTIASSFAANTGTIRGAHQHGRVGDDAGDAGSYERAVGAPAQLAAELGREGDVGVHRIGAGYRDQPGQHVGWHQRQPEHVVAEEENAEVDQRIDHAHQAKLIALSETARSRQPCAGGHRAGRGVGGVASGGPLSTFRPASP